MSGVKSNIFAKGNKVTEKRTTTIRRAGMFDFAVFLNSISKQWGFETRRLHEHVLELPMAASRFFVMDFARHERFNQPDGAILERVNNPYIASNRPFFYLLDWGGIVWADNENMRLIFKENTPEHDSVRFSIRIDSEQKWRGLMETGSLDIRKVEKDETGPYPLPIEKTMIIKEA